MNVRPEIGGTHTVGFLMVPNFSMIAFASAIEVLRLANYVTGAKLFAWKLYSADGAPVPSSNGVEVSVDGSYRDVGPMPEIIVCAGLDVQKYEHSALIAQLRRLAFYGVSIGAVCTGTYVLARAGLLDGHRCAIHWENYDAFREEFPEIEVTQELFEIDRNRFTCAGGTAAVDMMLALVANKKGPSVAALITDEMIHHRMRDSHERQRMELRARLGVSHPKLLAVIAEMDKRLERPLSCAQLSKLVHLSPRQLERLFQRYLDTTPTRYYLGLRLNRARHLIRQTSMPILSVGLACGFVSASHFSKCYSEFFKHTPSEERSGARGSGRRMLAAAE
ncbi:GlxA family transcriptional regulator [Methyloraptor flagellatus]|jgi:transcriptional regulator GlxA family with amidase domain|uniref:GlxA family transcriptional regulator n=1 Tax=Methyloraptor flagellatus TaxID=3162530 RepID=A0AAU7XEV9_9HYPH